MRNTDASVTTGRKPYFPEITAARGAGIILVVLGHALKQTGETNSFFELLLSVIYSFHMPLFFVLSGFVSVKILSLATYRERLLYIRQRAVRLLIPYFVIGLFYMPLKFYLSSYAVKAYDFSSMWKLFLGENPNVSLWFLYTLFWCSVICALLLNHRTLTLLLSAGFLLAAAVYFWSPELRIPQYLFFFLLGIFLREHYDICKSYLEKHGLFWAMAALFILTNAGLYITDVSLFKIVTTLSGIWCTLALFLRADQGSAIWKRLEYLGNYSMDIYILSEPVQTALRIILYGIFHLNYILCTVICFLFGLLLPLPVSTLIVRRVGIFRAAILGLPFRDKC